MSSRIAGTGSAFPDRIVTNAEFCGLVADFPGETIEGFSPEWIRERTGIEKRHFARPDETVSELSARAGFRALEAAGMSVGELDGILLATCTPDQSLPAAATLTQRRLGAKRAFALDLNAACSGFHHAFAMAHALIVSGQAKNLLVIGADNLTSITDYSDRKSSILFGDGAGAIILSRADSHPPSRFSLTADGEASDLFQVPAGGSSKPFFGMDPSLPSSLQYSETRMQMKGPEIFKTSVRTMVQLSNAILSDLGKTNEDVDFVIPHQANLRILERVAKLQKIGLERFILNIAERGNTSAATVPTALDEGIRSGKIRRGHRLLIPVFGAGVTAGAAYVIY